MNAPANYKLLPDVTGFCKRAKGLFIDGQAKDAKSDHVIDVFDPASEEVIAKIAEASAADVDAAVQSASAAFEDGRWSKLRPADRERILLNFAAKVESHLEELAQIESLNQGKSINIARMVDVGAAVEYMRYVAGLATKITGLTLDVSIPIPPGARHHAFTRREPVGVVGSIAPWNFPLMIGIWKVMPVLAAGCTIVLKPSEITPLTSIRLAELAIEAGVPPGVFNLVVGRGKPTGTALVSHPKIAKISFTGSTAVGKEIGKIAAENVKHASLELGGKNPAIVLGDVAMEKAIPGLLAGSLFNSGQVCAAISRIYVDAGVHDKLVDALSGALKGMNFGPGLDPNSQVTPLTYAQHRDRVKAHIETAKKEGADIVSGGAAPGKGYYVSPTLVLGNKTTSVHKNEVFGPVISVIKTSSPEEAIKLANDTPYGLAASLWTENLSQTMDLVARIKAGTVWVNSHIPLDPNMPFGGYKESGIGRDFGPNSLEAYLETKSVCITY